MPASILVNTLMLYTSLVSRRNFLDQKTGDENFVCPMCCLFLLPVCKSKKQIKLKKKRKSKRSSFRPKLPPVTLLISVCLGGNPLAFYTTIFPPRVTRLVLRVIISLKDLCFIVKKVKKLEHLDMHQNRFSGSLCKKLPSLFPQLKTLRIR